MSAQQQQKLDALYALDNVLTIRIAMAQADWDAVRAEQPAGGICNFDWDGGPRYTWRKAASVEISGTAFPARAEFSDVGIKKNPSAARSTAKNPVFTWISASSATPVRSGPRICSGRAT